MGSTRLQTTHAYLNAFSELSYAALLPFLDESYTYQILPTSLNSPIRNIYELEAHAEKTFWAFKSLAVVPKAVFEDADSNAVVAYCDMVGELTGIGPWETESVIMLTFSEDGKRVVEQREFVDSAKARELKGMLTIRL